MSDNHIKQQVLSLITGDVVAFLDLFTHSMDYLDLEDWHVKARHERDDLIFHLLNTAIHNYQGEVDVLGTHFVSTYADSAEVPPAQRVSSVNACSIGVTGVLI